MGCFSACFGTSKLHPKSLKSAHGDQEQRSCEELQPIKPIKVEIIERPINDITESKEKHEEQLSCNSKKKVTFDLNATTYEDLSTQKNNNDLVESNLDNESGKEETQKQSESLPNSTYPLNHRYQNCINSGSEYESGKEETQKQSESLPNSTYSLNHRYQNCTNSDSEYEDSESEIANLDEEDGDDDDDNKGRILIQDESSESLFSLSIDSRKQISAAETDDKEVNSPMPDLSPPNLELRPVGSNPTGRDRCQYVHSVLNPVENITQWKTVKAKANAPLKKHQSKENINLDAEINLLSSQEPSFKILSRHSKKPNEETAVNTSLSSWLSESETSPNSKTGNSPRSFEDRPILGALTIEELKQFSASSPPRRSPSHSPDDMPIIGSVGSYWNHTGKTKDSNSRSSKSKDREDRRMNFETCTPFATRLEKA